MRNLLAQSGKGSGNTQQDRAQKTEKLAGWQSHGCMQCTLFGALARQLLLAWRRIVQIPHTSRHHKLESSSLHVSMHSKPCCRSATLLSSDAMSRRFSALHLPRCCQLCFKNISTTLFLPLPQKHTANLSSRLMYLAHILQHNLCCAII